MSATSNINLNQSGGRPPNGPLHGVQRDPGTVYFALKPEPDVIGQVVRVGNHLCARHELAASVRPSVLHMTICAIGYFPVLPEERVETARGVAGRLVAKPFEMILNRADISEWEGKSRRLWPSPLAACPG